MKIIKHKCYFCDNDALYCDTEYLADETIYWCQTCLDEYNSFNGDSDYPYDHDDTCQACGGIGYGEECEFESDWINYGNRLITCPYCGGSGIER